MAMSGRKSKSLFDDIFRLQNAAPDEEMDPEDPEDGAKARLVDAELDEVESVGPSSLRKQTAIISDDPRYKGRKTSRKDLYSDEEEGDEGQASQESVSDTGNAIDDDFGKSDEEDEAADDGDSCDDDDIGSDSGMENGDDDDGVDDDEDDDDNDDASDKAKAKKDDVKIMPESKSDDDRKKGKAVVQQLEVWDDLIKNRIVLQKLATACNRLPQPDTWPDFWAHPSFRQEAKNVHSSVRKVVSSLLDLQSALSSQTASAEGNKKAMDEDGSDEEITSESEVEEEDDGGTSKQKNKQENGLEEENESSDLEQEKDDDDDTGDEDDEEEEEGNALGGEDSARGKEVVDKSNQKSSRLKRKLLSVDSVEGTLAKRHTDFQKYRNDTLSKWDEKTRLAQGRIKSKNFAAFELSVLKQIEQVLVNRERLVRRIHQKRSEFRVLGKPHADDSTNTTRDVVVEDDEDDVEMKLKQRSKTEVLVDPEIIDDNDFYHVCLRDLIEMKQNEETDPVMANKQWLEIQRLRNKQKQKVDTKASKGRKIRYNVKEKLKNYMTPYDKSFWSEEQKDDLFKALCGGKTSQNQAEDSRQLKLHNSPFVLGI